MYKRISMILFLAAFFAAELFSQPNRVPVTMTPEEMQGYLAGEELGQGKPAEVFGYPEPKHVLELANELGLTSQQKTTLETIFGKMQREGRYLGHKIVAEELALDDLFRSGKANLNELSNRVEKIGYLRWKWRLAHLSAHLMTHAMLSPEQLAKYRELQAGSAGSATQN